MSDHEPEDGAKETPNPSGGRYAALRARYADLVAEFGAIAFVTHFSVGLLVFLGFAALIRAGVDLQQLFGDARVAESAGVLGTAFVLYKLTFPPRIMITIALTPLVATVYHRLRGRRAEPTPASGAGEEGVK